MTKRVEESITIGLIGITSISRWLAEFRKGDSPLIELNSTLRDAL